MNLLVVLYPSYSGCFVSLTTHRLQHAGLDHPQTITGGIATKALNYDTFIMCFYSVKTKHCYKIRCVGVNTIRD